MLHREKRTRSMSSVQHRAKAVLSVGQRGPRGRISNLGTSNFTREQLESAVGLVLSTGPGVFTFTNWEYRCHSATVSGARGKSAKDFKRPCRGKGIQKEKTERSRWPTEEHAQGSKACLTGSGVTRKVARPQNIRERPTKRVPPAMRAY